MENALINPRNAGNVSLDESGLAGNPPWGLRRLYAGTDENLTDARRFKYSHSSYIFDIICYLYERKFTII